MKTVFQGYIEANQSQTVEFAVPTGQRTNLIYMFKVGDHRTIGKLIY